MTPHHILLAAPLAVVWIFRFLQSHRLVADLPFGPRLCFLRLSCQN
jgi:hypothetical protein